MKTLRKVFLVLFIVLLAMSFSLNVFAASSITYEGHNFFGFGPGSEFTDTDLFDGFKNVMPGDVLTEIILLKNEADCCDFIKIYIRAEIHNYDNPISPNVGKHETVVTMQEFLSKLKMTVWNGSEKIYEDAPHKPGEMEDNILLGSFRKGEGTTLNVRLEVPAELTNEYAYRVGEVDWIFVVEEYDYDNPDVPQTGDDFNIVIYFSMIAISLFLMVFMFCINSKKHLNQSIYRN